MQARGACRVVFMGGALGVGNRSSVAEFNILCDPEAAQMATWLRTMLLLSFPIANTAGSLGNEHEHGTDDHEERCLSQKHPGKKPPQEYLQRLEESVIKPDLAAGRSS